MDNTQPFIPQFDLYEIKHNSSVSLQCLGDERRTKDPTALVGMMDIISDIIPRSTASLLPVP